MMNKSIKQKNLEKAIKKRLKGKPLEVVDYLFSDKEIQILHEHANVVSIKRFGFNDHGPVHMRKAALNALIMFVIMDFPEVPAPIKANVIGALKLISKSTFPIINAIKITAKKKKDIKSSPKSIPNNAFPINITLF